MPALGDRLEAPLSRLARFGPKSAGDGFWSGLAVGAALGFVYAPCAGPDARRGGLGRRRVRADGRGRARLRARLGAVLLVLALAGRRARRGALRGPALSRALGGVMV